MSIHRNGDDLLGASLCDFFRSKGFLFEPITVFIQQSVNSLDGDNIRTDENGFFRFSRIPTGSHRINITGHPTLTHFETMVYRGHTARVGPTECAGAFGTLEGRACGPHGRWLTHATISIDMGFQVLETQTDHWKM